MGKKIKKSKSSKKRSKDEEELLSKPTKSIKKDKSKKKKKKSKTVEEAVVVKSKKELKAEAKALKKAKKKEKKKKKKKKKKEPTPPPVESDSSDSGSSDEAESEKKLPKKVEESSDSDSDAPPKKVPEKVSESSDEESSDEEKPPAEVQPAAKKDMDSNDSSDDSDSEDESAKAKKVPTKAVVDEEDSDESSSDDSSDGAETEKLLKAKADESDSSSSESEKEDQPPAFDADSNKRKNNFGDGFGAKKPRTGQKTELKGTTKKIFCGNLSYDIDDEKIKEFFKEVGELTDIFWLTDRDSGDFKGCGFLTFDSTDAADKACEEYAGKDLMGRSIKIDWAEDRRSGGARKGGGKIPAWVNNPLSPRPDNCYTVFCGNLDFNIKEEDVKEHFKDCGEVKSVRWLQKDGEFKGAGFVEFNTTEGVDKAVKLCGKEIIGRAARVDYAKPRAPRD